MNRSNSEYDLDEGEARTLMMKQAAAPGVFVWWAGEVFLGNQAVEERWGAVQM